jgi:hypothetical protein
VRESDDFFAAESHFVSRRLWLAQDELAIAGELSFDFFIHLLIGDAGSAHFVLVLREDLANFVVQAILNGEFFHHPLSHARNDGLRRFGFDLIAFDEALYNFRRHVANIVPSDKHPDRFPFDRSAQPVYWQRKRSARRRRASEKA